MRAAVFLGPRRIEVADRPDSGRIRSDMLEKDVTVEDADHGLDGEIDAAFKIKYRRYAGRILNSVLTAEARSTTVKLMPR